MLSVLLFLSVDFSDSVEGLLRFNVKTFVVIFSCEEATKLINSRKKINFVFIINGFID